MNRKISYLTLASLILCSLPEFTLAVQSTDGRGIDYAAKNSRATDDPAADSLALLRRVSNNLFKVEQKQNGDMTYFDWVTTYNPPGTKENFNWRLQANVIRLPGQSDMVRLWFNCGQIPEKVNPEKLAKMLEWNGGHETSRAYFKTGPASNGFLLSIVVDVPLTDVEEDRFSKVVDHMLKFAYDTMPIWGATGEPLAINKPSLTIQDLAGQWTGDVKLNGDKVGEWAAQIKADGFIVVSRANTQVANPTVEMLTGTARIEDGLLKITYFGKAEAAQSFEVTLVRANAPASPPPSASAPARNMEKAKLTLSMKNGNDELRFELEQ